MVIFSTLNTKYIFQMSRLETNFQILPALCFTCNSFYGKPTQIISHSEQQISKFIFYFFIFPMLELVDSVPFHNNSLCLSASSLSACGSSINRAFQVSEIGNVHSAHAHTQNTTQTRRNQPKSYKCGAHPFMHAICLLQSQRQGGVSQIVPVTLLPT